jgi:thioredoxin reductase (NADPH)
VASFDYDVVIVGSGPAGLSAGCALSRGGHRTLVLERDVYGGALQHVDWIADYAANPAGISGADLASALLEEATADGVTLQQADVSGVEVFSRSRWVATSEGRGVSCGVVVLAGGSRFKRLGLPEEERLRGRGMIECTPCDAGFYIGKPVVVVGTGDFATRDAAYLRKLGVDVTRFDWLDAIVGQERVESVQYGSQQLPAVGVAVRVGTQPNTEWLADLLELDAEGRIPVDEAFDTELEWVVAAGDIRGGSPLSVAAAVADGEAAARRAAQLLATLYLPRARNRRSHDGRWPL